MCLSWLKLLHLLAALGPPGLPVHKFTLGPPGLPVHKFTLGPPGLPVHKFTLPPLHKIHSNFTQIIPWGSPHCSNAGDPK